MRRMVPRQVRQRHQGYGSADGRGRRRMELPELLQEETGEAGKNQLSIARSTIIV